MCFVYKNNNIVTINKKMSDTEISNKKKIGRPIIHLTDEEKLAAKRLTDRLYYHRNKDVINDKKRSKKTTCDICGKLLSARGYDYHMKSKKHLKNLLDKNIEKKMI